MQAKNRARGMAVERRDGSAPAAVTHGRSGLRGELGGSWRGGVSGLVRCGGEGERRVVGGI
jgi:hypothetical protein